MIATLEASLSAPAALAYHVDRSLDSSIDALVADCCTVGESLDDATDAVVTRVRRIAPTDLSPNASDWEERWRAYYDFYDHAVARTIRSYVECSIQAPCADQVGFDRGERPGGTL
jgi:hypothetical protein